MSTQNEPTIQSLAEGQQRLSEGLDNLSDLVKEFIDEQRQFNEEQRQFNERVDRHLERVDRHLERVDRRLGTIQGDIAEVKGGHARTETIRRADVIASGLNLIYERTLSAGELEDMVRENSDTGIARNELESFAKADLVIKAKDSSFLTNYIAVEISYTADRRDTDRAARNASLLNKFTRRPSHPVIASVRNDYDVQNLIANETLHWYQIPLRALQTD